MTRTSLLSNFDGIKVTVYPPHPPYFRHGNGFQVRTRRRWDYGKIHQVCIIIWIMTALEID